MKLSIFYLTGLAVLTLAFSGCGGSLPSATWPTSPQPKADPVTASPDQAQPDTIFCTTQYEPVCAAVPVQCITAPCPRVRETFSNACEAGKRNAEILYAGECETEGPMSEGASAEPAQSASKVALPSGDFQFNGSGNFFGTVYVRGFGQTVPMSEAWCEGEDCATYQALMWQVQSTGNPAFADFVAKNQDNSFVESGSVGLVGEIMLGCLRDEALQYANHSDRYGMTERKLTTQVTQQLLSATAQQPIDLKLTKLPLEGGMGAPTCYSHFYEVEVVTSES